MKEQFRLLQMFNDKFKEPVIEKEQRKKMSTQAKLDEEIVYNIREKLGMFDDDNLTEKLREEGMSE